jgi:hypothetical protein
VLSNRRGYSLPASYAGPSWVTAGVDVGRVFHVRISKWLASGKAQALFIGEAKDFNELAGLWDRYGVNLGVVDERPEIEKAHAFAKRLTGRVMLNRWSGDQQRDEILLDPERPIVSVHRTWACDSTILAFTKQNRWVPRELPPDYLEQVTAPHKIVEVDEHGKKIARYKNVRADHYFFAETYDLIARLVRGAAAAGATIAPPTVRRGR